MVENSRRANACWSILKKDIFTYSTVRSATIESKLVAIIYRLMQLAIITYVIGIDIILNKGYQTIDTATSTVTTKVKGLGYIQYGNTRDSFPINQARVFDTSDYIVPPNEYNSVFIMSNFVETIQTQGHCDESENKMNAICTHNNSCTNEGVHINTWNGIPTGKCINSSVKPHIKVCEIKAWCPVERDPIKYDQNLIQNVRNFTLFVKSDIEFKKFGIKERNILPNFTNYYISTCRYHPVRNPYCPIFLVDDILKYAEPDFKENEQMILKGGIIEIGITWNCDYDVFAEKCLPVYSFNRFDAQFKHKSASSGFNFRFSSKYIVNGSEYRTQMKAFGLRIILNVNGVAGKFSPLPLLLSLGSGIGLLTLCNIVADYCMLNFTSKRKIFQKVKQLDLKKKILNTTELAGNSDADAY